jgi:hypothetical protein
MSLYLSKEASSASISADTSGTENDFQQEKGYCPGAVKPIKHPRHSIYYHEVDQIMRNQRGDQTTLGAETLLP